MATSVRHRGWRQTKDGLGSGGYLSLVIDGVEVRRESEAGSVLVGDARIDLSNIVPSTSNTDGAVFKAGASTTPASTPIATTANSMSMHREIYGLDHTSSYGVYFRSYVRTAGISADAFRAFGTVHNVAAGTARGAHISLSFSDTGTVTGLGAALEATLHVPNQATQAGTLYAVKAAINSDGATSDTAGGLYAYFGVVNQGNATGGADVDDDAYLFHIDGHTIGSGNMVEASTTEANYSHSIRARVGSTTVYVMCASAAG